jgi:hypothetical protein
LRDGGLVLRGGVGHELVLLEGGGGEHVLAVELSGGACGVGGLHVEGVVLGGRERLLGGLVDGCLLLLAHVFLELLLIRYVVLDGRSLVLCLVGCVSGEDVAVSWLRL